MANRYTNENIIVGAADVYVGADQGITDLPGYEPAVGETPAVPYAFTAGVSAKVALDADANWRHVGLTQGGVEFAYAPDFGEVDVDQYLDVAKMFKQRQSVTVGTTFAEATLDNLLFAWGQPVDSSLVDGAEAGDQDLIISGGALGDKPVERSVVFVGPAPGAANEDTERVYYLARALNVESSAHSLSKTEATVVPVSMRCLPVGDLSGKVEYGRIIERTFT